MTSSRSAPAARVGGASLILAAILFIAAFSYLSATFDYPDILDRPAGEVLPRLIALGPAGRAVWSIYALVPLLLIPAGLGAAAALRRVAPGAGAAASTFATLGAISMMLGLARWPSFQWELARAWGPADEAQRAVFAGVFAGLNSYLGVFVGEFVGELCLNLYFALTAYGMLQAAGTSRPLGFAGLGVAALGFVAMFRNVTTAVAPVAAVNNFVLPLWLVVLGVALFRFRESEPR